MGGGGGRTYIMKGAQIILAQGPLKALIRPWVEYIHPDISKLTNVVAYRIWFRILVYQPSGGTLKPEHITSDQSYGL